jgi:hypothetical protein
MPVYGTGPGSEVHSHQEMKFNDYPPGQENEGAHIWDGEAVQDAEPCQQGYLSKAIAATLKESQQVTSGRFKIDAILLHPLMLLRNS